MRAALGRALAGVLGAPPGRIHMKPRDKAPRKVNGLSGCAPLYRHAAKAAGIMNAVSPSDPFWLA
ncbi:hypothetical protein [Rhizobium tubonense]|uniref:Uncharacterized protein n=1 Tax=Rhizobium tubonense TaxID=484088 RepID=A0A2W4CAY5_9HYPH|nr:hypothetical protein [Rhizobium tubonense]PZM09971.1 hypothetical protein CPY51_24235 [Rhizobium tubonense]